MTNAQIQSQIQAQIMAQRQAQMQAQQAPTYVQQHPGYGPPAPNSMLRRRLGLHLTPKCKPSVVDGKPDPYHAGGYAHQDVLCLGWAV